MFRRSRRAKRAYETDWELLQRHEDDALNAFVRFMRDMIPQTEVFYGENLRDPETKAMVYSAIKEVRDYKGLVETYFGWAQESKLLLKLAQYATGAKDYTKRSEIDSIKSLASSYFQEEAVSVSQQAMREAIPQEILQFLPSRLTVEVDPDGKISKITDFFANEKETIDYKMEQMKQLLLKYNKIVEKVEKDLHSKRERTMLIATIVAIIMETGIRPGGEDTSSWAKDEKGRSLTRRVDDPYAVAYDETGAPVTDSKGDIVFLDGQRFKVKTFGAATLKGDHLNFAGSFATLKFVGKSSTTNLATITNRRVMEILGDLAKKARIRNGNLDFSQDFLFVDSKGGRISADSVRGYFKRHFEGVKPNDFRKLKGTVTLLETLQAEQASMKARILKAIDDGVENVEDIATEAITDAIRSAVTEASYSLNHSSGMDVTIENYLNPRVILNFLQTGRVAQNIREAVMYNPTELVFDPRVFIENIAQEAYGPVDPVRTASMRRLASFIRGHYRFASLGDLLDELDGRVAEEERMSSLGDLLDDLSRF